MTETSSIFSVELKTSELKSGFVDEVDTYTPYQERPETYIVPLVFLVIFVVGFVGNVSLISVLLLGKGINTSSYLYIFNLALGDFIVIIGTVPFVALIYTFESWPFGEIMCKISEFVRDVSVSVTIFTLTVMSLDRYQATSVKSFHRNSTSVSKVSLIIVVLIWTVSIIIGLPAANYSFIWHVNITDDKIIQVCYPFPLELGSWYPKLVVMFKLILLYLIPLLIISCCYTCMSIKLISIFKTATSSRSDGNSHCQFKIRQRNLHLARFVLMLVFIFFISFFPNHIFMVWFYFNSKSTENYNNFWHIFRIFAFILTFLNSCLNPVVLFYTSSDLRNLYKKYYVNYSIKFRPNRTMNTDLNLLPLNNCLSTNV